MLTSNQVKEEFEQAIKELGGEISTEANFDPSATHIISMRPAKNEKILGGIASGKWILHLLYIQECQKHGKFLDVSAKCFLLLNYHDQVVLIIKNLFIIGG